MAKAVRAVRVVEDRLTHVEYDAEMYEEVRVED